MVCEHSLCFIENKIIKFFYLFRYTQQLRLSVVPGNTGIGGQFGHGMHQ